jgi:hypothetical protein
MSLESTDSSQSALPLACHASGSRRGRSHGDLPPSTWLITADGCRREGPVTRTKPGPREECGSPPRTGARWRRNTPRKIQ